MQIFITIQMDESQEKQNTQSWRAEELKCLKEKVYGEHTILLLNTIIT